MKILTCNNLSVAYDKSLVISNTSFEIEEGDYVLIVGENGSGKSTLIKTILGIIEPKEGKLLYEGGLNRNNIGYLAQQNEVKRDFPASVMEVVLSGFCGKKRFMPFYSKAQKQVAADNIKKLDMQDYINTPISELSGGQRRRVLLARALCSAQKMILCDEPGAGLDALGTKQLYDAVKKLNDENIAVMMVTHDLSASLPYANKIIHMANECSYFMTKEEYIKSDIYKKLF